MHVISNKPVKAGWLAVMGCSAVFAALAMQMHWRSSPPPALPASNHPADLPLAFERNMGQTDPAVDFISRGRGYTLFVTPAEAVLRVQGEAQPLRLRWMGAAPAPEFHAELPLPGLRHVFRGAEASAWRHVPAYAKVRYPQLYPGIDLVYYGARGELEYDWVVAPGADPSPIRMDVTGAEEVRIDASGALELRMANRTLRLPKPVIYQEAAAGRRAVEGGYRLLDDHEVGFWLADYDATRPLVIDPVLVYGSYLGGAGADRAGRVAVDASGNVYLAGETASADFPVTAGARHNVSGGGSDAFVAKFDAAGRPVYVSYLGGAGTDRGTAVAADASGAAYVVGTTDSANFPTMNPRQTYAGNTDGFVAKLSPDGASLVYSTYLGGSRQEAMNAIAVDGGGAAYVGGGTLSTDLPVSGTAPQTAFASVPDDKGVVEADAFVSKLSADGSALVYSTYLGGVSGESVFDLALAPGGALVVVGGTKSTNFPVVGAVVRGVFGGFPEDGFITRINAAGTAFEYSSFFGGNGWDSAYAVAVDGSGNMYLAGVTASTDLPVTAAAPQRRYGGGRSDGFAAKINAAGDTLLYATYLGGGDFDQINAIALGADGALLLAGESASDDFPLTRPLQAYRLGGQDAVVARLNAGGTVLDWSSYWGGGGDERATSAAHAATGRLYLAGTGTSADLPAPAGAQTQPGGDADVFVMGLDDDTRSADVSVSLRDREDPVALNGSVIYDVTVANQGPDTAAGVSVQSVLPEGYSLISATSSQGSCSGAAVVACELGTLGNGASAQVALTVRVHQPGLNTLTVRVQRALQSDSDVANNTAREETTVTAGHGGGSWGPLALAGLLWLLVQRQRARRVRH